MTAPEVGDVVAWAAVPDGALARDDDGDFFVKRARLRSMGRWVFFASRGTPWWDEAQGQWLRSTALVAPFTIIALSLTGQETAVDLQRMAEVFEVREALLHMKAADCATEATLEKSIKAAAAGPTMGDLIAAMMATAERLHAAGWRAGMTAEDAARLLAAAGK